MKRPGISKSTRFRVFARDGYTCRYCGRKSDEVKLILDHVIPVAKGGTNEEVNLATSCEDCNSGKGVQDASPNPDNENVRLSRLQAFREQEEAAKLAVKTLRRQSRMRQIFVNEWCEITGRDSVDSSTASVVYGYIEEFGMEKVLQWVLKAHAITGGWNDKKMGKYISGIRRHAKEDGWE